tara:strand:+ start:1959 stop:3077 length:1119 start_codon:yes stop_codon:yes gene_type:complete
MAANLWLMHELTNTVLYLGILTFTGLGPILVLSMWGGVIADRVNRVRLVTITRGCFSGTALLTGLLVAFNLIQPWHLISISLINGILLSFDIPSRQAMVPNLLPREHLVNAFALQSILGTGSAIIGPVFLPLIEKIWGIEGVFMIIGVAYAFTTIMFSKLSKQEIYSKGKAQKPWSDLIEGFSYIRQHRVMIALISIGIVAGVFTSSYTTLLPVFAEDILEGGVQSYGYMLLSGGIGGMIGAILMAQFARSRDSSLIQVTSGVGLSLSLVIFALNSNFVVAVLSISIVGAFGVVFSTINNTFLQNMIADEYRGRVSSIHQLGWGSSALGGLFLGFLAQTFGPQFGLSLSASIATVSIMSLCFYIKKKSEEKI